MRVSKRVSKRIVSFLLVALMMASFCVSASAAKVGSPRTKTKTTEYGILKGEIWIYDDVTSEKRIGWEPTVRTSIDSKYTMAETTVNVECQYDDTGTYPSSNWCAYKRETNKNYAEVNMYFTADNARTIAIHSTHGVTYSKSYSLYMVNTYYDDVC